MHELLDRPPADIARATTHYRLGWGVASSVSWAVQRAVPLALFATLGGLLFWGHTTGWSFPKSAAFYGAAPAAPDDWCPEHGVPESSCVECNADILPRPKSFGWCKKHGVHECPLCHPELAQTDKVPVVTAADLARADRALAFADRAENSSRCRLSKRRIQFASVEAAEKVGIEVEPVWTGAVAEAVSASGEVTYDQTKLARLSSRVPGTVVTAFKRVGDRVKAGELVAVVDAAEVGRAKADFVQALVHARLKAKVLDGVRAAGEGVVSGRSLAEAESASSEARIRSVASIQALVNLGFTVDLAELEKVPAERLAERVRLLGLPAGLDAVSDPATPSANLLPVVAPFDGVVSSRDVVAGEVVDATKVLFVVVDPRTMWVTLDVQLEDVNAVRIGQVVRFKPDGAKEGETGAVAWVSGEADHRTRTVKVRAEVDNAARRLRANTFGSGRIVLREEASTVVVPAGAVQWEGTCSVVFVRDKDYLRVGAPKVFHTRTVRVGARTGSQSEIIAGVLPGEIVVVKGSAVLRAELLKNNLGAGCDCCNK